MFGISGNEFIVLLAVAAIVLGPERLPHYAQQLTRLIRELRRMAQGASQQVRQELGPEFDEVDWRKLDPRQYDPRRIVREALADSVDLDDPLGLKDKPVSAGGPQPLAPAADGAVSNGAASNGAGPGGGAEQARRRPSPSSGHAASGGAGRSGPAFDPDAT